MSPWIVSDGGEGHEAFTCEGRLPERLFHFKVQSVYLGVQVWNCNSCVDGLLVNQDDFLLTCSFVVIAYLARLDPLPWLSQVSLLPIGLGNDKHDLADVLI